MTNTHRDWKAVVVPEGNTLRRKTSFEYTTLDNTFDLELFENQDGTCYAIAVPRLGPVVVYGSSIVTGTEHAIRLVIDKIEREKIPGSQPE